ncbi:MAG: ABC transporter ATP-binding protein [Chitinophagaceae bacterium]|nr:ABC transporter ATP-binding protein [Chitinophagaceae bacterium]
MALLQVNGISKEENGHFAVKAITFSQQASQKIAIAGETGSGKTTLLKLIAGLVQPDRGEVLFKNTKVAGPLDKLIPGHPAIAYLSQHFELRNNYRVEEELESKNLLPEAEANRIYTVCRIGHLLKRRTDQLSGGERQRIVLARLLTTSPELLLLDEPFSNLDAAHKTIIKTVIDEIGSALGISCILVSHDATDTLPWADKIIVLKNGELIQQGTPEEIYQQPVDEYCAALFGEYNLISILPANEALKGKQLLVRPEQFRIGDDGSLVFTGVIQRILYHGAYYTLEVQTGEQLLKIRVNERQFATGDTITFSTEAKDASYI